MDKEEIENIIGIPAMDSPCISAKTGLNVEEVLEKIVVIVHHLEIQTQQIQAQILQTQIRQMKLQKIKGKGLLNARKFQLISDNFKDIIIEKRRCFL